MQQQISLAVNSIDNGSVTPYTTGMDNVNSDLVQERLRQLRDIDDLPEDVRAQLVADARTRNIIREKAFGQIYGRTASQLVRGAQTRSVLRAVKHAKRRAMIR